MKVGQSCNMFCVAFLMPWRNLSYFLYIRLFSNRHHLEIALAVDLGKFEHIEKSEPEMAEMKSLIEFYEYSLESC